VVKILVDIDRGERNAVADNPDELKAVVKRECPPPQLAESAMEVSRGNRSYRVTTGGQLAHPAERVQCRSRSIRCKKKFVFLLHILY
jgi:hypothetical protein